MPIIIAVAVVSLLSAANREILIPRYRAELSRRPQDPAGDKPQALEVALRRPNQRHAGRQEHLRRPKADRGARFPLDAAPAALREYGDQLTADNAYL